MSRDHLRSKPTESLINLGLKWNVLEQTDRPLRPRHRAEAREHNNPPPGIGEVRCNLRNVDQVGAISQTQPPTLSQTRRRPSEELCDGSPPLGHQAEQHVHIDCLG